MVELENKDPGTPGDGETAVCLLRLLKPKLLPAVTAPAVWICAECSSGRSEGGLCSCCLSLASAVHHALGGLFLSLPPETAWLSHRAAGVQCCLPHAVVRG